MTKRQGKLTKQKYITYGIHADKHLNCKGSYSENQLNEITLAIMNISYSKGGCYLDDEIEAYAEVYVERFV